jgi:hypothetical protein
MRKLVKWALGLLAVGGVVSIATRARAEPGPSLPRNVTRISSKFGLAAFGAKMKGGGRAVVVVTDAGHESFVLQGEGGLLEIAKATPDVEFYFASKEFVLRMLDDFGLTRDQLPIDVEGAWGAVGAIVPTDDGPFVPVEHVFKTEAVPRETLAERIMSAVMAVQGAEAGPPAPPTRTYITAVVEAAAVA